MPSSPNSVTSPKTSLKRYRSQTNIHENAIVTDINIPFLYEAHSILLLFLVIGVIMYFVFNHGTQDDESTNIIHGLWLCVFLFLAIGCLVFPAGPFIRPHPILYRFLFGLSVLYVFILLMLLCQTPDGARKALTLIDSSLGVRLEERSYATDCTLNYENFMDKMDIFVTAHFLGWAFKAMCIRDRTLVWIWSLLWELIEIMTCWFIPNFAECWWDSILLDFFICNGIGIEIGLYLCNFLHFESATWLSVYKIPTVCGKIKRFVTQFTPSQMIEMHWETTSNIKRFFFIQFFLVFVTLIDLNGFLLKLFLWIPANHYLFVGRAFALSVYGSISGHQFYLYMSNPKCKKMGSQSWMMCVMILLEITLCYKCRPQPFPQVPLQNKIGFTISGILYLVFSFIVLKRYKKNSKGKRKGKRYNRLKAKKN